MKTTRNNPARFILPLLLAALFLLQAACLINGLDLPFGASPSATPADQASPQPGVKASPQPERKTSPLPVDGSQLDLPNALVGLSSLSSYHLSYSSIMKGTQKGQPYEFNQALEGWVYKSDQATLVQQSAAGTDPVYLSRASIGGVEYIQQEAGGACQANAKGVALITSQTLQLPPVFGAKRVGPETLNGMTALHYQFDQKGVPYHAGKDGKAQGDVWVAQDGGYVLKYTLTLQLPSGDFVGTHTWSYALDQVGQVKPVALPEGCQALLTDIPVMEKAANVIQRPGFQSYSVAEKLDQVVKFYQDRLVSAGWALLPGIEASGGRQTLEYAHPMADGGSRFVVIQATEANGQTGVIVQSGNTRKPIVVDATPTPGKASPTKAATAKPSTGKVSPTPPTVSALPADIPSYPGTKDDMQTGQMAMLTTSDAVDKVAAFYKQAMPKAGYILAKSVEVNSLVTQLWKKGELQIIVAIMPMNGTTQIIITIG
jgi:hypothetical protein